MKASNYILTQSPRSLFLGANPAEFRGPPSQNTETTPNFVVGPYADDSYGKGKASDS